MAGLETLGFAVNHDIRSKKIYNLYFKIKDQEGE